jgi:hypothetical protein
MARSVRLETAQCRGPSNSTTRSNESSSIALERETKMVHVREHSSFAASILSVAMLCFRDRKLAADSVDTIPGCSDICGVSSHKGFWDCEC